jgi:BMFP domain-containing protein YqiC
MEKYNKFLRNITELIEKGLFTSKDLKKEVEDALKFQVENIANRLNLVSREEFEVQKKRIEKLQKDLIKLKTKKGNSRINKKIRKVKKL